MSATTAHAPTATTPAAFANLQGHQYANLTTFRKTGVPVTTPVWFAHEGGKVYIVTQASAGKLKRIRHTRRVTLGPSDARGKSLGPTVEGWARILPPAEHAQANQLLNRKYGLLYKLFMLANRLRGGGRAFIEVTPEAEGGTKSGPKGPCDL